MRGKQYPVMQFTKPCSSTNGLTYGCIEILSCNNKTYITAKLSLFPSLSNDEWRIYESNDRHNLQFTPMKVFGGLVHTLHAVELGAHLSRLTRTLEYAATLDLNPIHGEFSDSNRLMDWVEKAKLEYENAHKTKAGIDRIVNSFYNSLTD